MIPFLLIFLLTIYAFQVWSRKHALKGIRYDSRLSKKMIEPEEEVELISTVTNESRRFVPFVRMVENLPKGVRPLSKNVQVKEDFLGLGNFSFNSTIYLMPRSRVKRKLRLTFPKRGHYLFQGAELHGGDFIGFFEERKPFKELNELIVYPNPLESPQLHTVMGGFLGDISVRRFMMEDPVLTIGAREYTGRESWNQISWKATARTNKLMVKQYDYTTELVVTAVLDVSPAVGKVIHDEEFERCYSLMRSVCQYLEKKNIEFDFASNARLAGMDRDKKHLQSGVGKQHLRGILELLGRASYGTFQTFEKTLESVILPQASARSVIWVMPQRDPYKEKAIQEAFDHSGSQITFIYGEDYYDISQGLKTHL